MMSSLQHDLSIKFKAAKSHMVVAPSGSGKTKRVCQYLRWKNFLFENGSQIKTIILFYSVWQNEYEELKRDGIVSVFFNFCPTSVEFEEIFLPYAKKGEETICVIDDFQVKFDQFMLEIVSVKARHLKVNLFLLVQSLFQPGNPFMRQISLNVSYIHIFRNQRDLTQFSILSHQLQPGNSKWLKQAFYDITRKPYTCLLINLTADCPEELKFVTNFLPHEFPPIALVEKRN